MKGYNQGLSS